METSEKSTVWKGSGHALPHWERWKHGVDHARFEFLRKNGLTVEGGILTGWDWKLRNYDDVSYKIDFMFRVAIEMGESQEEKGTARKWSYGPRKSRHREK
jgi:hypothetical protein